MAQIDDVASSDVLPYLHTDHLGTPKFATNTGGTQVWAANSDAFGVGTPSGSVTVNLRMPGQYADSESGLFYNWNRYYNPEIGRYISSDPIGLAGGLNTFSYVSQSPVMYVDPEGKAVKLGCMGGAHRGNPECVTILEGGGGGWGGNRSGGRGTGVSIGQVIIWCLNQIFGGGDEKEKTEPEKKELPFTPNPNFNNESADGEEGELPQSLPNEDREKNCNALRESILATCASLSGEKARRCRFVAQDAYDQCMED